MSVARRSMFLVLTAAGALAAGAARADRIDGDWCDGEGRRIEIAGSAIKTPGGATVRGDYGRHAFAYDAPAGETPAGRVEFTQSHDDLMHERSASADPAKPRPWKRCRNIS